MKYCLKHREKKKNLPVIRYLVYLLLVTIVVTGVTFSRYSTSFSGSDATRTAKFSFNHTITDPNSEDSIPLNPSIYATCKLSDAKNCDFDDVAVVRTLKITNTSEVPIRISLSIKDIMSEDGNGIVWCVLDEVPAQGKITQAITAKLNNNIPKNFPALQTALEAANDATFSNWNADADLDIIGENSSKFITIVFWAEHDIYDIAANRGTAASELATTVLDYEITVVASQID